MPLKRKIGTRSVVKRVQEDPPPTIVTPQLAKTPQRQSKHALTIPVPSITIRRIPLSPQLLRVGVTAIITAALTVTGGLFTVGKYSKELQAHYIDLSVASKKKEIDSIQRELQQVQSAKQAEAGQS